MSRFYFDFRNDSACRDEDGVDFASADDARREARHTLVEVAGNRFLRDGAGDQTVSLCVRDGDGEIVFDGSMSIATSPSRGASKP